MSQPGFPSKAEVDRIGDRIRAQGGRIVDDDLPALRAWRRRHEDVVQEAVGVIADLGFESTPRVKTLNTMVEKVVREHRIRLSQVQDIAGVRIVMEGGLRSQDAVGQAIHDAFPDRPRVYDRRAKPSHGYRALHIVVRLDVCLVEVQIRTGLQHAWAEAYEALADLLGRGVRYGEMPSDPRARSVVEEMQQISELVRESEEAELADLGAVVDELDLDGSPEARELRAAVREFRAQQQQVQRAFERMTDELR